MIKYVTFLFKRLWEVISQTSNKNIHSLKNFKQKVFFKGQSLMDSQAEATTWYDRAGLDFSSS